MLEQRATATAAEEKQFKPLQERKRLRALAAEKKQALAEAKAKLDRLGPDGKSEEVQAAKDALDEQQQQHKRTMDELQTIEEKCTQAQKRIKCL